MLITRQHPSRRYAPSAAPAAVTPSKYVRAGATGTGSGDDWENAYTALPATLTRGTTYWIADGTYPAYAFDDAVSGTTPITVKKATVASHNQADTGHGDTGWQDSYGDGQAVFSATGIPISIETNYWVLDGVTGSENSGHGFKAEVTGTAANIRGVRITATSDITLSHWEVTSTNPAGVADGDNQDGIYSVTASNVAVSYCYIHDWKRIGVVFSDVSGWVIDHCYFYHTYSTTGAHGQAIQLGPGAVSNVDIRYCTFKDCHGTGHIVAIDNTFDDIRIYGNLHWQDEITAAIGLFSISQVIGTTAGDTGTNFKVYNNTFIGLNGRAQSGLLDMNGVSTGNEAYNNIWYNSNVGFDGFTHDYNASDDDLSEAHGQTITSAIFVDYANGDFRLASATTAGTTLAAPYTTDRTGVTRGADGTWDRGAYEHVST